MTNENQGRVSARPVVKFVKMAIEKEGRSPTRQEAYEELTREDGSVRYHHEEAENSIEKAINDGVVKERTEKGKKVLDIPGRQQGPANPENPDPEEDEMTIKSSISLERIYAIILYMIRRGTLIKVGDSFKTTRKDFNDGVKSLKLSSTTETGFRAKVTGDKWYVPEEKGKGPDIRLKLAGKLVNVVLKENHIDSESLPTQFTGSDDDGEDEARRKQNTEYVLGLFDDLEEVEPGISKDDLVKHITKDQKMDYDDASGVVEDAITENVIRVVDGKIYRAGNEPEGSGSDDAIRKGAKDLLGTLEHAKTHKVAEKTTLEGRVEKINGDIEEIDGQIEAVKSTFGL